MQTFWVGDQIKTKLSYASDVTYQPPDYSKYDKICDKYNKQTRKTTNFKTKSP